MINRTQEWKNVGRRLRKAKIKHCRHCHSLENLMADCLSSNGTQRYTCRKCNTLRSKKYRKTENGKNKIYTAVYKSIKLHQDKQNARLRLRYQINKGTIIKPKNCEKCKKVDKLEAHHYKGYEKENSLKVVWLCKNCHCKLEKIK